MRIVKGKGIVPEIAIGRFLMIDKKDICSSSSYESKKSNIDTELKRFRNAVDTAAKDFRELSKIASERAGEKESEIFETHRTMLLDDDLSGEADRMILDGVSAIDAVKRSGDSLKALLLSSDSDYMRQRAADVEAVCKKLIEVLSGEKSDVTLSVPSVIGAFDLTPAQTLTLDRDMLLGFVTGAGGTNSHTAILARSMNIPAVVGAGEIPEEADGATVILDGCEGLLIISPDDDTLKLYRQRMEAKAIEKEQLTSLINKSVTYMGKRIRVYANIAEPEEADTARKNGADGIGLFRSEFIYMKYGRSPSEEEQFEAYTSAALGIDGKEIIIRTLDAGADKEIPYLGIKQEPNPALGMRAIRLCLSREELFTTQLKAILRASAKSKVSILLPMIADLSEIKGAKRLIDKAKSELEYAKKEFDPDVPVGIMIETPSAAIMADKFAKEVDFFSVGTNDLIQYTMVADRQNGDVSYLCEGAPEPVMRLLANIGEVAVSSGIWAGICGEMAGDTSLTEFFLKSGYTELSVSPPQILKLKKKLSEINGASVQAFDSHSHNRFV